MQGAKESSHKTLALLAPLARVDGETGVLMVPDLLEHLRAVGLTITADGGTPDRHAPRPADRNLQQRSGRTRPHYWHSLPRQRLGPQLTRSFSREADVSIDGRERWTGRAGPQQT